MLLADITLGTFLPQLLLEHVNLRTFQFCGFAGPYHCITVLILIDIHLRYLSFFLAWLSHNSVIINSISQL